MATRTKANPGDFTGRQREKAAAAAAEEIAKRNGQIATTIQVELDRADSDVFDPATQESLGEYQSVQLDLPPETVVIRVLEDIEDMTFGAGTHLTFEAGKKYTVSKDLADYLASLDMLAG